MRFESVQQSEREDMRLAILQVIYKDEAYAFQGMQNLCSALKALGIDHPFEEVRRAVLYLQKKGMLIVTGTTELYLRLTAEGIDLCEGNYPPPAGISTPGEVR